ncbi:unnamed protein product [Tuber melanosporum]|uniref:poly(A)-specific ribonuclease n=1 Tax=Tuber melanosporum (strain Mel28) TaxID=656061 RepID=D5GEL7_TUBMM|nr:uncharacterized protein GSTUM_00006553001 [Tuber melanosporum]CAZ82960.1 unnamed protein product [Tuber melanosporum]
MPPTRSNLYTSTLHGPPQQFAPQQQGGHPMGAGGGGGGHVGHNPLLGGDRFGQPPHLLFNNAQPQSAAAVVRAQQQHQQQQAQAAQLQQQQQAIIGLIGRSGGGVSAAGLGGVVGRAGVGVGPSGGMAIDVRGPVTTPPERSMIRDVWAQDLDKEMAVLRDLVETYQYVAMDTEFPGIVARPIGNFKSKADYHYQTLRCNVDMLKIIQLGITLADENGNLAKIDGSVCTWQFNFKFSLNDDMYAQESIDLLTKSGIDFAKHAEHGIDVYQFGNLLISSGLVMYDDVKWISFHSGYDFGYLVKIMSCLPLPKEESEFRNLLSKYFPALYDIKFLMKSCRTLKGGLQDIAEEMGVSRVGPQHQAGSDSLLTGNIFFEMREKFFDGKIDDAKYLGQVWGLNGAGISPPNINGVGTVVYNNGVPVPSTPTTDRNSQNPPTPGSTTPSQQQQQQQNGQPGTPNQYNLQYGKIGGM